MGIRARATEFTDEDVKLDALTNAILSIDTSHHETHQGEHYSAFHSAASKNDGTTINIYLKTPAATSGQIHLLGQWASSGAAYMRVYEAPTITANTGTNAKVAYNSNRGSSNTSGVLDNATTPAAGKYGIDVTKTGDGTIIYSEYSGAGKQGQGGSRSDNELVLAASTVYLFEVESDAAGLTLSLNLAWYEHSDSED